MNRIVVAGCRRSRPNHVWMNEIEKQAWFFIVQAQRLSIDQRLNLLRHHIRHSYRPFRERKYDIGIPARAATTARKKNSDACLTRKNGE